MPHEILATFFLWLLVLAVAIRIVAGFLRSPFTFMQSLLFIFAFLLVRLLWKCSLPNRMPLAPGQGAVLVCNHRSSIDPFFIQMLADKPVHWMVAREYFKHPVFGWFLRTVEAIPVGRGGIDTAASKIAIRYAAEGEIVGMFPEGRINMTEQFMLPGRPGAALIALRAKVVMLPCLIEGSPFDGAPESPLFMPAKTRLQFGEPIDLSEYASRQKEASARREIMSRCLLEIAHLAGRADYQPQFAGRNWKPSQEEVEANVAAQRRRLQGNA